MGELFPDLPDTDDLVVLAGYFRDQVARIRLIHSESSDFIVKASGLGCDATSGTLAGAWSGRRLATQAMDGMATLIRLTLAGEASRVWPPEGLAIMREALAEIDRPP